MAPMHAGNTAGRQNFGLATEIDGGDGGSMGGDSLKLAGPRPGAKLPPTPPRVGAGAGAGGRGMGLEAELQQMGLDDPRPQVGHSPLSTASGAIMSCTLSSVASLR